MDLTGCPPVDPPRAALPAALPSHAPIKKRLDSLILCQTLLQQQDIYPADVR